MSNEPLTAAVIEILDKWFSGVKQYPAAHKAVVANIEALVAQEVAAKDKRIAELSAAEKAYCRNISLQEKQIKSLTRMLKLRDTKIEKLKAHIALMGDNNANH